MTWIIPPRRRYLQKKRAELLNEAEALINDLQNTKPDLANLEKTIYWMKDIVNRLEEINKELDRINTELGKIPRMVPKLGLAEVRELLEDECEVWMLYAQKHPRKPTFRTLHSLCQRALMEFNHRNWDDAYYLLAEMYNIMVEVRRELEPIMARDEGRRDMFDVELDYVRQLGQWVRDMRYKGERLAGIEELRRWHR